jgi:hypothetical protein
MSFRHSWKYRCGWDIDTNDFDRLSDRTREVERMLNSLSRTLDDQTT